MTSWTVARSAGIWTNERGNQTCNTAPLLAWSDHEHGPGRTHLLDEQDETRTMCGKDIAAIGGREVSAPFNCRGCAEGVAARQRRAERRNKPKSAIFRGAKRTAGVKNAIGDGSSVAGAPR
jgi:hypothetical protein